MRKKLIHWFVFIAVIAMLAVVIESVTVATSESNQLSFGEVVSRVLGLEKRVDSLEKRLAVLEQEKEKKSIISEKEKPLIEITSPRNGDEVGMNVIVEGTVHVNDITECFPCIAVHPLRTNLIWIQPPPVNVEKMPDGYRFRCRVFCGTAKEGIGENFEIYALLPEKGALKEGDQLDRLPKDVPVSLSVLVTRK
jgi:hypothetical protein